MLVQSSQQGVLFIVLNGMKDIVFIHPYYYGISVSA